MESGKKKENKEFIKSFVITFVFILASVNLIASSNEIKAEIQEYHKTHNSQEDKILFDKNNVGSNIQEDSLNIIQYNKLIQKFIIAGIVFSISFILFIQDIQRFSILEKIEEWQQNKK